VDFVVADVASGEALLVVELDNSSHQRPDRQLRDLVVNEVLRSAGIPIARFRPGQKVDVRPHLLPSARSAPRTSVTRRLTSASGHCRQLARREIMTFQR